MSKERLLFIARKIIVCMVWDLNTAKNITVTVSVIENWLISFHITYVKKYVSCKDLSDFYVERHIS